jgi:hypothetical protein
MKGTLSFLTITACALAIAVACSKQSSQPNAPSAINPAMIGANADGSTLKVTAPAPQSPVNGVRLPQGEPVVLTFGNSTIMFSQPVELVYRIEVMNGGGGVVETAVVGSGAGSTSRVVTAALEGEQTYRWRVRAEYQGAFGPWSTVQSFIAPPNNGYIRGNELYDPLNNGQTVGEIHGPVTFIPGAGARLESPSSYIEYQMPEAVVEGEYSALVTGLGVISRNEDPKWRVLSMREGFAAINDNEFRMTVEKRGNGAVAWRFITGSNRSGQYIETVSSERRALPFHESLTYFIRATWVGGEFRVVIQENGVDGDTIYDYSKGYSRSYTPFPHMVEAGSPYQPGDRGEPSSVAGMVIRQIWVSPNPRPAYANK